MQVCEVCVPPVSAASSLLADAMSPEEWAVFRHVTGASPLTSLPAVQCQSPRHPHIQLYVVSELVAPRLIAGWQLSDK
jgi:hypothetical protein